MEVRQLFRPGIKMFWLLMICYVFSSVVCLNQERTIQSQKRTIQKQQQTIRQLQSNCN
jgi:hypothetical protein